MATDSKMEREIVSRELEHVKNSLEDFIGGESNYLSSSDRHDAQQIKALRNYLLENGEIHHNMGLEGFKKDEEGNYIATVFAPEIENETGTEKLSVTLPDNVDEILESSVREDAKLLAEVSGDSVAFDDDARILRINEVSLLGVENLERLARRPQAVPAEKPSDYNPDPDRGM